MFLPNKRFQSIIVIVLIAIAAVVGLLLLMSRLATPDGPPLKSVEATQQPIVVDVPATQTKTTDDNNDEVAATVNNHVITQQEWDKATRLDAVMNRLARQSPATAEQTLDQLINEIIVLAESAEISDPTIEEVETRTLALEEVWRVSDDEVVAALEKAGLTRTDLTARINRLIQVQMALDQMAKQQSDLDGWLLAARASAEIGLYQPLVGNLPPSIELEQESSDADPVEVKPVEAEPATDVQTFAPPPDMSIAPYVDNTAPDFTLTQLNGEPLTLSNFRGKPTLVNFWASWCPPCRKELPALQNAYTTYSDKIGFIAVDVKEDVSTVTSFIESMKLDFPIVLDPNGEISNIMYEVRGIPTTVFVDANGVVAARHVGPLDEAMIDEYLAPLLEQTEQVSPTDDSNQVSSALTMITGEEITATVDDNTHSSNPTPTDDLVIAPIFTTTSGQGEIIDLQNYQGQSNVVLVFYRGNT